MLSWTFTVSFLEFHYTESRVFYHMTNLAINWLEVLTLEAVRFCSRAIRLFPAPLIRVFHQWFCKESARRAVRVI